MARYGFITFFATLGLLFPSLGSAESLSLEKIESLSRGALPEVREFITRKLGCTFWESTQPREKMRSLEGRRALKKLRCGDLNEDEKFLRDIYAAHLASISALDAVGGVQVSASRAPDPTPASSGAGF